MLLSDIKELFANVISFRNNVLKDNYSRRVNLELIVKKLRNLDEFQEQLQKLEVDYLVLEDKQEFKDIASSIEEIKCSIEDTRQILLARKSKIEIVRVSKMSEKFDLKTAGSLLPVMNDTEEVTKQLIDAIELYASMLDEAGKSLLINYVLKVRLSVSAKLRISSSYTSIETLIVDLRKHLLTKKSASSLSIELHNAKQNTKSIEEYGRTIEELLVNLCIAQSDGNENSLNVLRPVNEKTAISTFANGLRNSELRTILKARNYDTLKDAIAGAKDEEKARISTNSNVFHAHKSTNFQKRVNYKNNFHNFNRGVKHQFHNKNTSSRQEQNQQGFQKRDTRNQGQNYRGNQRNRGRTFTSNYRTHAYCVNTDEAKPSTSQTHDNQVSSSFRFFRE